jgi:Transposase, Mutator family
MTIDRKLIDQLLSDYKRPEDIIGENGLLKELTKAILERALAAEMSEHLGYEKHDPAGHRRGNTRNGNSKKTLKGDFGELGNATRPAGDVRAQDRRQAADALDRFRRQDHLDVRAGDDHARDPGPPGRDVRH